MLSRRASDRRIAIPQPAHARVSGRPTAAWGNARFAPPAPATESVFAATLHDIGWTGWERPPDARPRDQATGRPG